MRALATRAGDSEPVSAFESDSDGEYTAHSNYCSSHDNPDGLEDEESNTLPTPEPELTELEAPDQQRADQHSTPKEEERPPIPKEEEERPKTPKEEEERPLTEEERPPTPSARVPTPNDDMSFQYPQYRDDPDAEAHVYAFLKLGKQTMCHRA